MTTAPDIRARLIEALSSGEVIGIRYQGGSQPGAYREIVPLRLSDDTIEADCRSSKAIKTFRLDRIELCPLPPNAGSDVRIWNPDFVPIFLETITAINHACCDRLKKIGWHVVVDLRDDGDYLLLYNTDNDGLINNYPSIILSFEEKTWDLVSTPSGKSRRTNVRRRGRPWVLTGRKGELCGAWYEADRAVEAFLAEAASCP